MTELQREALAVLAEVWALSPEVRLGQLLAHLGFLGEVHLKKVLATSRMMNSSRSCTVTGPSLRPECLEW
jgi:hypothetical protein